MLETPHVLIGAAIATQIPNPFVAVPLAFASHFVMEMIPHWNPHLNAETKKFGRITKKSTLITAIDATLALVFGSIIAFKHLPDIKYVLTILACCFFSVLPDLIEGPYFFLKMKNKSIEKWIRFQKMIQADAPVFFGLLTQAIAIVAAIYWIRLK